MGKCGVFSNDVIFSMRGFTLIEAIMAMAIISIAMLGLGAFTTSILKQDQLAHDRNQAVQIASQVLEEWTGGTAMPTTVAVSVQNVVMQLNVYANMPVAGVALPDAPHFYVVGQQAIAQAPMRVLGGARVVQNLFAVNYTPYGAPQGAGTLVNADLRTVTVLWSEKDQRDVISAYRVVLSNIVEVPGNI